MRKKIRVLCLEDKKKKRRRDNETNGDSSHRGKEKLYLFLHFSKNCISQRKEGFASLPTYLTFDGSMMLVLCQIKTSDQKELNMEALMRGLGRQMEGHHPMQTQPLQRLHMKPLLFQENKLIFLEIQCSQMGCWLHIEGMNLMVNWAIIFP